MVRAFDISRPALGFATLLCVLTLSACDQKADSIKASTNFHASEAQLPADFESLARGLSADALNHLRHEGERVVEVFDRNGDTVSRYAYRERVATDGEGQYSIRFIEALTELDPDPRTFELQHFQRQGLNYRYRDFAIRDCGLFERNYRLRRSGAAIEVAGRDCTEYEVERISGGSYRIDVDDATGVVLRYEELDAKGDVLTAMQYETFNEGSIHSQAYYQTLQDEVALTWEADTKRELDRAGALRPKLAPRGYELRDASTVTEVGGKRWLKLVYTDGVESAFFLCALPDAGAQAKIASPTGADEARVYRMGAATVVQANLRGRELIAVGKVSDRELLDLLESALP